MQKRMIIADWTFFKAGQGCFYGGRITTRGSKPFTFVYDCGSNQGTAILKKEITDFRKLLTGDPKKELDMLVLSHLDSDHVNQVDYLLRNCTCKIAVLPYLFPAERLHLYFSNGFDDSTDDDIYSEFIQDPAAFLINRGVQRVIFITGNGENGVAAAINPEPDNPESSNSENDDDEILKPNVRLEETDPELYFQEQQRLALNYQNKVEFKKGNGDILAGAYWQFYFFQMVQEPENIQAFRDKITEIFGVKLEDGHLQGADLKEIFADQDSVDLFKRIFKVYFKETNSTGLLVMHGPVNQLFTRLLTPSGINEDPLCYTLLSGDTNMRNPYSSFIKDRLPYTRFFQIPHHGSVLNWHKNSIAAIQDCYLVINYGTLNTYKHPGAEVRKEILMEYPLWHIEDNTELNAFSYRILSYIPSSTRYGNAAPMHLTHRPVIATINSQTVDDPMHQGTWTDVESLSVGKVQWDDPDSFSVKVWRNVNGRWSRQSEEVPLHRALDLAILVITAMIEEKTGHLAGHHLSPIIVDDTYLDELHEFINDNRGLLEERLNELNTMLRAYAIA